MPAAFKSFYLQQNQYLKSWFKLIFLAIAENVMAQEQDSSISILSHVEIIKV